MQGYHNFTKSVILIHCINKLKRSKGRQVKKREVCDKTQYSLVLKIKILREPEITSA